MAVEFHYAVFLITPNHWSVCRTSLHLNSHFGLLHVLKEICSHRWTHEPPCSPLRYKWRTIGLHQQTQQWPRTKDRQFGQWNSSGQVPNKAVCWVKTALFKAWGLVNPQIITALLKSESNNAFSLGEQESLLTFPPILFWVLKRKTEHKGFRSLSSQLVSGD